MHAVAPIVLWVGGNVDSLRLEVGSPEVGVDRHQILQLKHAPHGGRSKVLPNDRFTNPGFAFLGRVSRLSEFLVEEFLCDGAVFLPPAANRAHVMGRGSYDTQIGGVAR